MPECFIHQSRLSEIKGWQSCDVIVNSETMSVRCWPRLCEKAKVVGSNERRELSLERMRFRKWMSEHSSNIGLCGLELETQNPGLKQPRPPAAQPRR